MTNPIPALNRAKDELQRYDGLSGIDRMHDSEYKKWIELLREVVEECSQRRKVTLVDDNLGRWMSAALDDPQVCDEMKVDIHAWFHSFHQGAVEDCPAFGLVDVDL